MKSNDEIHKNVRGEHLERAAYVYVRQSSFYQVEHHHESRRRQYELVTWAHEAGWPAERVVVVDEDQGKSGAVAHSRSGFDRLAAAVARGEVGIVISLEASRLARNSPDWHHLMYVCRWSDTLIADEKAVYDLSTSADRMVLGLRGQISELELDHSIHRMVEARWSKARRGETFTIPPAGYDIDDLGQLVMTSDEAVAHAIATVFTKFEELGTARQVCMWWREQGLRFPVRCIASRSHPIVWEQPRHRQVLQVLHHPIYAGAYVFGRTKRVRELNPDDPRKLQVRIVRRRRDQWPVLIRDHHEAYIGFEKYLEIQQRIEGNRMMECTHQDGGPGAAREGRALLQGLARCGQCGRRMYVSYGGNRGSVTGSRTMQYRCKGARPTTGAVECQLVGGKRIDEVVARVFLEATEPAGVEAAAQAEHVVQGEHEAVERAFAFQVEKAQYEAQRAERQFNAVEPENRVVARELERRWNARLLELEAVRAQAVEASRQRPALTEIELARAKRLGTDLEAVWHAQSTTNSDRKRLLRCLIEEVQLGTKTDHYDVRIVWKGGAIVDREVKRIVGGQAHATAEDTIELVRKLAVEFDDTQIARILNRQRRRSGLDKAFTKSSVMSLRGHHQIPVCTRKRATDAREGPFTADEAARELGVSYHTVHRWLRDGILSGEQLTPGAPWRIVLTEEIRKRLAGDARPNGWVGLSEAARRLGLAKSHVAHLVNTGKLPAVRATVGKRQCWIIDVSSATCGRQQDFLDQTGTDKSEEA